MKRYKDFKTDKQANAYFEKVIWPRILKHHQTANDGWHVCRRCSWSKGKYGIPLCPKHAMSDKVRTLLRSCLRSSRYTKRLQHTARMTLKAMATWRRHVRKKKAA